MKKLSNHLTDFHHINNEHEREHLLRNAKSAPPQYIPQVKDQTTLKFAFPATHHTRESSPSSHSPEASSRHHHSSITATPPSPPPSYKCNTRGFSRFSSSDPKLVSLKAYLMSIEGKRKSEEVAEAIVRDTSKFLHFCNPQKIKWKWFKDRIKMSK